ncbi:hypothetical protein E6C60_1221 [Paenibacillus algicola]|uniref:GerMN domain-containing protein n=1 Tax=Paenibacillus algicola TaxID=2565926 RepID=A0A4P8XNQ1_9BACL|nr:GerMN domain-containing protein [Paenibacillus algicola]QCT01939.1 hypothetical protein E6C60_1221 [Paenibacillus algicola]
MTQKHSIRGLSAAGLLAVPILLAGCGPFGGKESEAVDPPPAQLEAQMIGAANSSASVIPVLADDAVQNTVYLSDSKGMLAPVTLALPKDSAKDPISSAIMVLVKNSPYAGYIPEGFSGVLPAGTEVTNVTVDAERKLAMVEFNEVFKKYDHKEERRILEALTWTLTGQKGVEKAELWVAGEKLTEMPLNRTPLDRPLSRTMGINLQKADDTQYSQSSPVTVYFSGVTPGGVQYYVPVTRLVPAGQDAVQAAVHELIRGPQFGDGLAMVMTGGTTLTGVEQGEDGSLTVALSDSMFQQGDHIPAELLQAVVLTVTENAGATKVKIKMNDLAEVTGTDSVSYSQPVSRPEHINEIPI